MKPLVLLLLFASAAQAAPSDPITLEILDASAALDPETASFWGRDRWDEQAIDLRSGWSQRRQELLKGLIAKLERRAASESAAEVKLDLEILIAALRLRLHDGELSDRYLVPYFPIERMLFEALSGVLEDQIAPARRQKMVVRLRAYAGLEPGRRSLVEEAMARTRERLGQAGLIMPPRAEVERNLATAPAMLRGIEELYRKYALRDWQWPMAVLRAQLGRYEVFLRAEILPRAREDFRLPAELYAQRLAEFGIDTPPEALSRRAHEAFTALQREMDVLAAAVAKKRGWTVTGYRAVLAQLKKEQLVGDAILPHYRARLAEIEAIIRDHKLVTLPSRPAEIRLATEAESAHIPAPFMHPPPFIGNTGQRGVFVLPLALPAAAGKPSQRIDDFTYAAASWTLTAHEARPGHELQFDQMVERGVSLARAIYAFNSVNAEGWGLYSEHIMLPYMPPEGQLVSLQLRLLRAARAFLDPDLHAGKLTPAAARRVLIDDVGFSTAMAESELQRYTFLIPGQAGSYFHGYTQLVELRRDVERRQGSAFDALALHDFILAQGLLPLPILRRIVLERFR